ncbi:MAG: GlpG protein [Cellvibrionaceae bacterium]|jgi:GlpG protein
MTLTWYPVTKFPLEVNLMPFLHLLQQRDIKHRVTEEQGAQQLWVSEQTQVLEAAYLSRQWSSGALEVPEEVTTSSVSGKSSISPSVWPLLVTFPINLSLIFLAFLGTLLIYFDGNDLTNISLLLFQPVVQGRFAPFSVALENAQYWRLITPIFLHFGFFHFLFNAIILWAMGSRIERVKGSAHFLLLVIIVAISSNMAQYLAQVNTAFGGLSGVVYGVIGYIAVYQSFIFHPVLQFNPAAIGFFIVWLVIGFTGIIDYLIAGSIANAAHLAGLLSGALIGGWVVWHDKKT